LCKFTTWSPVTSVLNIVVYSSVTASRQEGISKYLDEVFDEAYNTTVIEGDLPDVRWGRIDYLNVTFLTTKWVLWQYVSPPWFTLCISGLIFFGACRAPYLVFATDRGQTLRFVKGNRLRLNVDAMRQFLKEEKWKTLEPWSSAYSPGGSRSVPLILFVPLPSLYCPKGMDYRLFCTRADENLQHTDCDP